MALSPQKTLALVAPQRLQGLEKFPEAERSILAAINGARVDLLRAAGRPVATNLRTTGYLAREEEYVRAAPGTGGMMLQLPKATRNNQAARITVLLESVAHNDLFVQAIGGTVNTATTLQLGVVGRVDFISNGETGWFSERSIAGSTSIVESGGEYQLAAGTGDVTWAQNSTVTTIANDAVTNAKAANMAANTMKVRAAGTTGDPGDLAISTHNIPARIAGDLISHPLTTLAGAALSYDTATGAIDYVGEPNGISLGSITGAQGVVNIAALNCGGVVHHTASGNYDIDGFTAKSDGFWFEFVDRNVGGGVTGTFNNNVGNTTTSIRPPGNVAFSTFTAGRVARFVYINNRWRPGVGATA